MKLALLLSVIFVLGCVLPKPDREVSFFSDGFTIYGDYYEGGDKAIILLHMLGSDKSAWGALPKELNDMDYTVLNIDLRGHGKSVGHGPIRTEWPKFSEDDFSRMTLDTEGAKNFLKERGKKKFAIIGASIGANVAINFAREVPMDAVVMLSPGLDYRGIRSEDATSGYGGNALIVAADDDKEAADAARVLGKSGKDMKIFKRGGHGTDLLENNEAKSFVTEWIRKNL